MRWNKTEYSGWGRVLKANGNLARPERLSALEEAVRDVHAPAVGNFRSYGDAALNDGGHAINMSRMDRLIGFDAKKGIVEAEAGIRIGEIARVFASKGWIPAVMPGTGFATLGGCIANDVHGKNHHGVGSFGQHVVSVDIIGPDGKTKRITPRKSAKLFRATMGGLGQTGIIQSARIQLQACGSEVMDVRERRVDNLSEFMLMLEQSTAPYCVGWIDAAARGDELGRGILEEAVVKKDAVALPEGREKSVPIDAPGFMMSGPVVRLFNRLYYGRIPAIGRTVERSMQDFFFPLDRINNLTKLYGKKGFHQFQCVLPDASAADALARMMELISAAGLASPLAVLKRSGSGHAGLMSFPMEGFTLAVDFPNRGKVEELVHELEEITLDAGGRIYFAKDSLCSAETVAKMYPNLDEFAAIANEADPKHALETDMVRRLNLRGAL